MGVHDNKVPYKSRRAPLWLPYLQSAEVDRRGIGHFIYNGGEEHVDLKSVTSIMIYGDSDADLSLTTIDKITRRGIPIIVHRRNLAQSIVVCGNGRPDPDDTLTYQLAARGNKHQAAHVARALLRAKFRGCRWLVPDMPELPQHATIDDLRNIEAHHARMYWKRFFEQLGRPELHRREDNVYARCLDAGSKFTSGVLLRWIAYHHLSPYHGFLHEPTTYPSLVYDLMEPYRGVLESEVLRAWLAASTGDEKRLQAITISTLKEALDAKVYIPLTRQIVTRHELLHGIVLSLKYYVLNRQRRMLVPMEGRPNGGRPAQVGYTLYGRRAGKTDFWQQARLVAATSSHDRMNPAADDVTSRSSGAV